LWFPVPVGSSVERRASSVERRASSRAWYFELYHFWYNSELDARGSSSPAANRRSKSPTSFGATDDFVYALAWRDGVHLGQEGRSPSLRGILLIEVGLNAGVTKSLR
jgi:hypothetical protein